MANPSPPVGPALGQQGGTSWNSVKHSTLVLESIEKGLPIPVVITVYADRSFTFITKNSTSSSIIEKAAGIKSGSGKPNKDKVGKVTLDPSSSNR